MGQGQTAFGSQGDKPQATPTPVCCTDDTLPPAPSIGARVDPAEPHPSEPGAPDDAPTAVLLVLERTS